MRVESYMRRILAKAGSWWWFWLSGAAIAGAYYGVSLAGGGVEDWARLAYETPAGFALFAFFPLSALLVTVRIAVDSLWPAPMGPEDPRAMDAWAVLDGAVSLDDAARWAGERGYRGRVRGGVFTAVRGRWAFLPGAVMRVGLVVLLSALAASPLQRCSRSVDMGLGDEASPHGHAVTLDAIDAGLPGEFLQVGDRSIFELAGLSAQFTDAGGAFTVTAWWPTERGGLYWRLRHLGYAVTLTRDGQPVGCAATDRVEGDDRGEPAWSVPCMFDVLPPGAVHLVDVEGMGVAEVSLEAGRTVRKGLVQGMVYDLASPAFSLRPRGSDPGSAIVVAEGRADGGLGVAGVGLYVRVEAVLDPALPYIRLGLALALGGALLMSTRLFWLRTIMAATIVDGRVVLGFSSEYYRKWGVYRFGRWIGR
jgi:hypothetical protein